MTSLSHVVIGVVTEERLRCAQHGTVFSLLTGDLIEHPGLDSIHSFAVSLQDLGFISHAIAALVLQRGYYPRCNTKDKLGNVLLFFEICYSAPFR